MRALLLFLLLASLVFHAAAGRPPSKSKRATRLPSSSSSSEQSPESEDDKPLHVQRVTGNGSDEDELADDSGNEDVFMERHVRFRALLSPQTRRTAVNDDSAPNEPAPNAPAQGQARPATPPPAGAPFQLPTTPESTGRLYFGLNQQPPDTSLYERPGAAGRKAAVAGEADDQVGRQFHSWYRFSSDDRRRLFSELRRAACSNLYDMGASTGASFALFISRPETNPAQPAHLGDMYVSRSILRDENFMRTARHLWTTFRNDIARPRRQQFEALQAEAATLRQQYHDTLERLERAGLDDGTEDDAEHTTASEAKKRKREGKSRTSDASSSKKKKGRGTAKETEHNDPGNESTPQRPRTRQRTTRSGRASADDAPPRFVIPLPEPALDTADMAVDDEQEVEQLGEAMLRSRREAEEEERRREQPVASTSQLDDPRNAGELAFGDMASARAGPSAPKVKKEKTSPPRATPASATRSSLLQARPVLAHRPDALAHRHKHPRLWSVSSPPPAAVHGSDALWTPSNCHGLRCPRLPVHYACQWTRGRPIHESSDRAFARGSQASMSPPPSLPPTESDAGYDSASASLLPTAVQRLLEQFSVEFDDWDQVEMIYLAGLHYGATAHERWMAGLERIQNELNLSAKQVQKLALAMLRAQSAKN